MQQCLVTYPNESVGVGRVSFFFFFLVLPRIEKNVAILVGERESLS